MSYKIKKFIMSTGERGCLILDKESGLPVHYQNLYLTTMVRNRSATASTMEIVATNLLIVSNFLRDRNINIEERIVLKKFLNIAETEDLIRYAKQRFDKQKITDIKAMKEKFIAKRTFGYRIHVISSYFMWLCGIIHSSKGIHAKYEVDVFINSIRAHLPRNSSLNLSDREDRSLNEEEIKELFITLSVGSDFNPFREDVRIRNRLIFSLLFQLGLRAGELLNLRVDDLDLMDNTLSVIRRHDSKEDGRTYQPLVKTGERVIPLSDQLVAEIYNYISECREKFAMRKKHKFLLVTHNSGKTAGEPLSISAYEKIISTLKRTNPKLSKLSGHRLRHSWNYLYSKEIGNSKLENSHRDALRNYIMGWSKNSTMSDVYNNKYIAQQERETVIKVFNSARKLMSESKHAN
ncbi:site-specific integrase [Yersinia enterocolitica]|uniref:site-specific integrase n=1 Tax=Yersinia enterocolitica TaxID=630 RepID=UPI0005E51880|nr:site-specific integrase [Yersinia enterocolitica]CQH56430.1 putative integrase/recombinase [Yersinia enterocolitica]